MAGLTCKVVLSCDVDSAKVAYKAVLTREAFLDLVVVKVACKVRASGAARVVIGVAGYSLEPQANPFACIQKPAPCVKSPGKGLLWTVSTKRLHWESLTVKATRVCVCVCVQKRSTSFSLVEQWIQAQREEEAKRRVSLGFFFFFFFFFFYQPRTKQ